MQVESTPVVPGYRVGKVLGRGGMATVYLAVPEAGGDRVAIKVMRAPPGADGEWSARFLREAALLERFNHPNIVRVFATGQNGGDHYIVMEHLDHGDLTTWIRQGLKPEDALRLARSLALALEYAHQQGYLHRDIKPDNVLFRADGTPVLTDFGIARPRGKDARLTQVGMVVGTPRYMSPEQHKGLDVDTRADVYALGIVLFEMLTKQVPFDGEDSLSIGMKHLSEPVPRLPPGLARFQRLLDSLLEKDPAKRIAKADTVVKAIDLLLSQPAPTAKRAMAATEAITRGLVVQETETKTGLFSKVRDISIRIGAEDQEALQKHCVAAMTTLFEWHGEAGKKARHVAIDFFVHPWILARARDFVRKLAASDEYRFLADLGAIVRIHDLDGNLEHDMKLGEPAA